MIKIVFGALAGGEPTLDVSVLSPAPAQIVSGVTNIEWNADNNNPDIRVAIFHSEDFGEKWKLLANDLPNTGVYQWDTNNQPDGIFNKIRIVAWGDSLFGMTDSDSVFTINNAGPATPQIMLTSPQTNQPIRFNFQ